MLSQEFDELLWINDTYTQRCLRNTAELTRRLLNDVSEIRHLVVYGPAFFHQLGDFVVRVHHSGVVSSDELADLGQRHRG